MVYWGGLCECPYYKWDKSQSLGCEGGQMSFPDKWAAREYINRNCVVHFRECPIYTMLEDFYERQNHKPAITKTVKTRYYGKEGSVQTTDTEKQ